jgi:hypothetical protein
VGLLNLQGIWSANSGVGQSASAHRDPHIFSPKPGARVYFSKATQSNDNARFLLFLSGGRGVEKY